LLPSPFVEFSANGDPPVADLDREYHIGRQRSQGDQDKGTVVADKQDDQDERDFDQGRQDRIERVADQTRDRSAATLDVARNATGLPLQMKAQREFVQVAEDFQRDPAYGALCDAGKENLAQLGEQGGRKTQRP
jgi:hypothetical protein